MSPSILIYGHDLHLLETRSWVLEHAGFDVSTTSDLRETVRKIDVGFIDLFILCHTLSTDDCTNMLAHVHSLHPRMKMLILTTAHSGCDSKDDFVLRAFASPQALITKVRELTNTSFVSS